MMEAGDVVTVGMVMDGGYSVQCNAILIAKTDAIKDSFAAGWDVLIEAGDSTRYGWVPNFRITEQ